MVTAVCDDNSPTSTDSIALTESKQETAALFVPASDQQPAHMTETVIGLGGNMIRPGLYRHYKGNMYLVIGVARHSETLEINVVYQALYGEYGLWVRPLAMFTEEVVVGNKRIPRFAFVSEPFTHAPVVR